MPVKLAQCVDQSKREENKRQGSFVRKLTPAQSKNAKKMSFIWSKGIRHAVQPNKAVIVNSRPFFLFEGRSSTLRKPNV